jgi:hypothetical protein
VNTTVDDANGDGPWFFHATVDDTVPEVSAANVAQSFDANVALAVSLPIDTDAPSPLPEQCTKFAFTETVSLVAVPPFANGGLNVTRPTAAHDTLPAPVIGDGFAAPAVPTNAKVANEATPTIPTIFTLNDRNIQYLPRPTPRPTPEIPNSPPTMNISPTAASVTNTRARLRSG